MAYAKLVMNRTSFYNEAFLVSCDLLIIEQSVQNIIEVNSNDLAYVDTHLHCKFYHLH